MASKDLRVASVGYSMGLWERTVQANQTASTGVPDDQSALIEALRDQIEDLRRERDDWKEQARMTDRLLSAALERVPPQLEAPQETRESPQTVEEEPERTEPRPSTEGRQEPPEAFGSRGSGTAR